MTASTIRIYPVPYLLGILLHQKRLQHTYLSNIASQSDSVLSTCLPTDYSTFTSGTKPNQMHSVIQLFLLLPVLILTTTTTNAIFDSDTNDVIIRKPTSSYSAPPPYPPTSPCDNVPEMNRTSCFKLATTSFDDTYKNAWYLRKGGKPSEGNSKEMHEKVGNTGNGDDRIVHPDHHPCDGCLCAHFLNRFSEKFGT